MLCDALSREHVSSRDPLAREVYDHATELCLLLKHYIRVKEGLDER
jgi:hypothetical protein